MSFPTAFTGNCTEGEVRLVNGAAENEGRVEICLENAWGTICDDNWDGREARVVCRQLGYSDAVEHVAVHEAFFGRGANPIHLDEVDCVGDEERLDNCSRPFPVGIHNCLQSEDAGVVCTGKIFPHAHTYTHIQSHLSLGSCCSAVNDSVCANGAVRLVGGESPLEGRVEVCFGGRWGTVCTDSWDNVDAAVVCSQLGFSRNGKF